MADRYWVGGTGTWSSSNTANWSTTSGGAGGASVPTAADNVFFDAGSDAGSAFTVAVASTPRVCRDFIASGLDFQMTLGNTLGSLEVSGSLYWPATNFVDDHNQTTFNATTTGHTINTNGVPFRTSITFNGVGGGWTFASDISTTSAVGYLLLDKGAVNTAGYAVDFVAIYSNTTYTRSLTLGASVVDVQTMDISGTGMTLDAGTSHIRIANVTSSTSLNAGTGKTFYDVSFTYKTSVTYITGTNTYHNLSFVGNTSVGVGYVSFTGNQTITGALTLSAGSGAAYRTRFQSETLGAVRTVSVASFTAGSADWSFRDIALTGAASPISGTRFGDCGGNSGITFPAATTKYWNLAAGGNWTSTAWATSSGGAVSSANFPLPQDTAIIQNTGLNSGATITVNTTVDIGTLDMSTRTNAATFATSTNTVLSYGDWKNGSGITLSGTGILTFLGRTTQQVLSSGKAFTQTISINNITGTVQLQDNLTAGTTLTSTLASGTLDLQSYTFSTGLFIASGSAARTLAFGTGNITCTGTGTVFSCSPATNLTVSGSRTVNVTSTGATAITVGAATTGGSAATALDYNFTGGTYALTFMSGSGSYVRNVNFTGFSGTWGTTSTSYISGNLTLSSTMTKTASSSITNFAGAGNTQTINANGCVWSTATRIDNPAGTVQLLSDFSNPAGSIYDLYLTNGTLDLNGSTFTVSDVITETGTKNITFNGGTLKLQGSTTASFSNTVPTGFTTTAGSGTGYIEFASPTGNTFTTGGATYNCTVKVASTGGLSFSTSPSTTLGDIVNTVSPTTVGFANTSTFTFLNGFSLSGTPGNLVTIQRASGASTYVLSKASGTISVSYCNISNSYATGGATWSAPTSAGNVDGGGNSGWVFSNIVTIAASVSAVVAASAALGKNTRLATITSVAVSAAAAIAKIARLTFGPYAVDEYVVEDYYVYAGSKVTATARLANNLSAAAQVVVSASASLVKSNPLTATATSTSTATASLGVTKGFTSSVQAVTSATGTVARTANMAASVTCTSTSAASLNRVATLADLASTGSITNVLSAALSLGKPVAATAVVVTSATAAIARTANLSASSACLSTATGAVSKTIPLAASAVALASSTAATSISKRIAGSVFNVVTATTSLSVGKGLGPLAGTGAVTNVITAAVSVSKRMAVNAAVVSTGTANVILSKPIAAVASAAVTAIPNLLVGKNLNIISGQGAITNVMSAGLTIRKNFVGQLTCLTLIQGGLSINKPIAASAQSVVTSDVNLKLDMGIESAVTAEVTSSGEVAVAKPLAATVLALATINGRLVFTHINDIESLGVVTADIEAQQYYAEVEVVAPAVEAGQQTISADISASEMYASVTSSRLYADAVLLENDMVVEATADEIFVYKKAA